MDRQGRSLVLPGLPPAPRRKLFPKHPLYEQTTAVAIRDRGTIKVSGFRLKETLESGQFFRWKEEEGTFTIWTHGKDFQVRQEGPRLRIEGASLEFVDRFLGTAHRVASIRRALARDERLRPALETGRGIRILRQDPWECLVAFVTSQVSNIPRITRNLETLARHLGLPASNGFHFPGPKKFRNEKKLRELGLGFRARYLAKIAREVDLENLEDLSTENLRKCLRDLPGVGRKVADCVMLFAYGRREVFPLDTRIRRAMTRLYFSGRKPRGGDEAIQAKAAEKFGPNAGYAQQVLYMWAGR
jgi:N-glycosylase/DNA lyase